MSLGEARARPLDVAAANWVASALAVGAVHPDALMLDVGSTTADVIPIAAGRAGDGGPLRPRPAAGGRARVHRRAAHATSRRSRRACPCAGAGARWPSTAFAISADVHLILGHLAPEAYTCPTPDGRAASVECARERVARLVCADAEQLEPAEVDAIAAHVHAEQVRQIEAAARLVSTRLARERDAGRGARGGGVPRPRGGASASAGPWSSCRGPRPSARWGPRPRSPAWPRPG